MIEKCQAYKIGEETFGTLREAQYAALKYVLSLVEGQDPIGSLLENSAQVIDILTTTASSKPRARKVNGGTKKRVKKIITAGPSAPDS